MVKVCPNFEAALLQSSDAQTIADGRVACPGQGCIPLPQQVTLLQKIVWESLDQSNAGSKLGQTWAINFSFYTVYFHSMLFLFKNLVFFPPMLHISQVVLLAYIGPRTLFQPKFIGKAVFQMIVFRFSYNLISFVDIYRYFNSSEFIIEMLSRSHE